MTDSQVSRSSATTAIFFAAVVFAAALRLLVINNDLWLDEVWSVQQAASVESVLDIFCRLHHDNNHHLNTLWLWLCGTDAGPIEQRFLSLVTGVLSVVLTGVLTLRWGRPAAAVSMLIASASIMFVQYSTEARGYSMAVCSALGAHYFLRQHLISRSLSSSLAFGVLCTLGTLSHLSFLQYYFAATYWTSGALTADQPSFLCWCRQMLRCHLLAVVSLGILYVIDVRHLTVGGGPRMNAISVLVNAVSVFAGGAFDEPSRIFYFLFVVLGIVFGLRQLVRDGQDEWKFFACLFLLFPIFRVLLLPAGLMYERYFLILLAFAAIPISIAAVQMLNGKTLHRTTLGVLAIFFLSGNLSHYIKLSREGRGHYLQTMAMISNESPDGIRISSDHPFRNRLLIEYFAVRCSTPRTLTYLDFGEWNEPPEWMICHSMPRDTDPAANYFEADGRPRRRLRIYGSTYRLRSLTNTAELSGCEWLCYQLESSAERTERVSTLETQAHDNTSM